MKKVLLVVAILCMQLTPIHSQTLAFQRAATLGKGMNLSLLDKYWRGDITKNYTGYMDMKTLPKYKNDLKVMKQMGIKTLRLPIWFTGWFASSSTNPYTLIPERFAAIDSFIRWTNDLGMNIILDYHNGTLTKQNAVTESGRIAIIWKKIAQRYASTNPNRVFFEIYNEPNDDITPSQWKSAATRIIDGIRTMTKKHTLIVGGAHFNSIAYLDSLGTLKDTNIIYTFHFYDPFIFTHQGVPWDESGVVSTLKIPFPYNASKMPSMHPLVKNTWGETAYKRYAAEGTVQAIINQLKAAYQWQLKKKRPVFCGEFGNHILYTDAASRCLWTKTIRQTLENWKIPFAWWEWDGGFKMFNNNSTPSVSSVTNCFLDAWGITSASPKLNQVIQDIAPTAEPTQYIPLVIHAIYPTPTEGDLLIEANALIEKEITFFVANSMGITVKTMVQKVEKGHNRLVFDVWDLPQGIYFMTTHLEQGKNRPVKFVKI